MLITRGVTWQKKRSYLITIALEGISYRFRCIWCFSIEARVATSLLDVVDLFGSFNLGVGVSLANDHFKADVGKVNMGRM